MRRRTVTVGAAIALVAATVAIFALDDGGARDRPSLLPASAVAVTAQDGLWSAPATWADGVVPAADVAVELRNTVTCDVAAPAHGVTIDAGAALNADAGCTVASDANVIVHGALHMRAGSTLRFMNVDETAFVGGGNVPIATDVGLWVVDAGTLDVQGTPKTSWTTSTAGLAKGTSTLRTRDDRGWLPGDRIFIAPTDPPTDGTTSYQGFDEATITAVHGHTITLDTPLAHAHPMVDGRWTAELGDLTRDVVIEGSAAGYAHVFIHSTQPQTITYAELRYLAPQPKSATAEADGRYALHFHINGDASRTSQIRGVSVHDTKNHSYVIHASNGVTLTDDLAYNTRGAALWWDPKNAAHQTPTNDAHIDHLLVAREQQIRGSTGFREQGIRLGFGAGNTMTHSTVVGLDARGESAGFSWLDNECSDGPWTFTGDTAHNNHEQGLFVWCNSGDAHRISLFDAYYNTGKGIDHGAYYNGFAYNDLRLYGNLQAGILERAVAGPHRRPSFTNVTIDTARLSDCALIDAGHNNHAATPIVMRAFTMTGAKLAAVCARATPIVHQPGWLDLIAPTIVGNPFAFDGGLDNAELVRVINADGSVAYSVHPNTYPDGTLIAGWNAKQVIGK